MNNKSALVVDDSRVARMMLIKFLKGHGFEITEFGSGEEALSWLQTTEHKPDVIFMDVMMDGMDGLTATRQIKAIPELSDIPVVICTGNDTEEDRQNAMATGAASVLTKPPAAVTVERIIQEVEAKQAASTDEPVTTEVIEEVQPVVNQITIDEDAIVRKVLKSFREQFLPGLETQLRELTEEVGREVANQVAAEAATREQQAMLPELQQQVNTAVTQSIEHSKQQFEPIVTRIVSEAATHAVDQAVTSYGLTEKLMSTLHHEGANWLKQQEHALHEGINEKVKAQLPTISADYLDSHLAERIKPIIESQINDSIAQSSESYDKQLNSLKSQSSTATAVSVIAVIVAVAAVAVSFLF